MKRTCTLRADIDYDDEATDAESLAQAMDNLMDTALSTPGILDDYGKVEAGRHFVMVEDPLRCRYPDCVEQHPVIPDEDEDTVQVTCESCRGYMGLPPMKDQP